MRFVEDQRVVLREPGIALRFGEQNAVGHQLDVRIFRRAVGKTNLVADVRTELAVQFLGNSRGGRACGDAARLGVADESGRSASEFEADLGNLRRLAGTGLAADDHHLIFFDQRGDLGAPAVDRQLVGKVRHGQARAAGGDGRARLRVQRLVLGLQRVVPGTEQVAQVARLRAQTALVSGKAVLELGFTRQWM